MIRRTIGGVVIALTMAACGGDGGSQFVGTWLEEGPGEAEAQWVFSEDGSLSWNVIGQPSGAFGGLRYEVVSTGNPHELNITGFEEGPMAGQVLYCIAVFPGDDAMRMDCEPGPAEGGETNRPGTFSEGALDLTRQTGNGEGADTGGESS